jgi:hypothetical protein
METVVDALYPQMEAYIGILRLSYEKDFRVHDKSRLEDIAKDKIADSGYWIVTGSGTYWIFLEDPAKLEKMSARRQRSFWGSVHCVMDIARDAMRSGDGMRMLKWELKEVVPQENPEDSHLSAHGTLTEVSLYEELAKVDEIRKNLPEVEPRGNVIDFSRCQEYYDQVKAEVEADDLGKEFQKYIEYINNFANHLDYFRVTAYKTFPHRSFEFAMETKDEESSEWKRMLYMGLIYSESSRDWSTHT